MRSITNFNKSSITNLQSHIYDPNFQYQSPTSSKTPTFQSTETLILTLKKIRVTYNQIEKRGQRSERYLVDNRIGREMGRISCWFKSGERSMLTEVHGFGLDSICERWIRYVRP